MALAIFGLISALLVGFSGNAARLVGSISSDTDAGAALVLPAVLGQAVIIALMILAGAALAPGIGPEMARVLAAASLAIGAFMVLRPAAMIEPEEPTRSSFAIGMVIAAFAIRDGIAPLALALGLVAGEYYGVVCASVFGAGLAMVLALQERASIYLIVTRNFAAIFLAAAALVIGALQS